MQEAIRGNVEKPVTVTVERDGSPLDLTVTPIRNLVYTSPDADEPSEVGYVGVSPVQTTVRQPITARPRVPGRHLRGSVDKLVQLPERVPPLFRATFMGEERDPNGPIGVVGVSRLSGEAFALQKLQLTEKIAFFFNLLAGVNLVLFLFNLLPIYPLDGGHIAGAIYEKVRGSIARMRGRPDPGPFDIARLMPVAYAVAGLFVALSVLLIIADLVNPIRLTG